MLSMWFVFALLSLISLSGSEICQKISLTQKIKISAVTNNFVVWTLQGVGGLIVALLLGQLHWSLPADKILNLGAVAMAYFLGGTLFYTSYKGNSPSISIILGSVSIVISTTLGIIFLREPVFLIKLLGAGLVLVSIVILNYKKVDRLNKNNVLALFGGMCYGVAYTLDKSLVLATSPVMYVAMLCFSVAISSLVFQVKPILAELQDLKIRNYYPMIFSALFGTMFNFFTFSAYGWGGNVGAVDAINSSNVFGVILLEIVLLKDRKNLAKKAICAGMAVVGLVLLSNLSG